MENESDIIKIYIDEVSKIPLLSKEEEKELAIRISMGDKKAREEMISKNLKLVVSIAKNYSGRGVDFLDLIQEGTIGLIGAIDNFDVSLGNKLSTYADARIRKKMIDAINIKRRGIRLPDHVFKKLSKCNQKYRQLESTLNRTPSFKELSDATGEDIVELSKLYMIVADTASLNDPMGDDLDEYIDWVESPEDSVEDQVIGNIENEKLREVLTCGILTDEELKVISMRFGFADFEPMTLEEIGKQFDVTRERIRQIEKKALKNLRRHLKFNDNKDYEFIKTLPSNYGKVKKKGNKNY